MTTSATSAPTVVETRKLTKSYSTGVLETPVLRGIDLEIREAEFVAIMGPSGSGKSTLLHLLGGLDTPSSGEILLGGKNMATLGDDERARLRRTEVGFIFQAFNLLPMLTALDNVMFPLLLSGTSRTEARKRAAELLDKVKLGHRNSHYPAALSGGEQQRVAIARALSISPRLIIADEPTGSLDSANSAAIIALLRDLVTESRYTVLMVTHDPGVAAQATRMIHMLDGRIESDG